MIIVWICLFLPPSKAFHLPSKATLASELAPALAPNRLSANNSVLESSSPLWCCSAAFLKQTPDQQIHRCSHTWTSWTTLYSRCTNWQNKTIIPLLHNHPSCYSLSSRSLTDVSKAAPLNTGSHLTGNAKYVENITNSITDEVLDLIDSNKHMHNKKEFAMEPIMPLAY